MIATIVMIIGLLPFIFWDGQTLFENMVAFNLTRPVRESSILFALPHFWQSILPLLGLGLVSLLSLLGNRFDELNLKKSWFLPMAGVFLFLLSSKMTPYHYFVWLLPFLIFYFLVPQYKNNQN